MNKQQNSEYRNIFQISESDRELIKQGKAKENLCYNCERFISIVDINYFGIDLCDYCNFMER